ncbi:MAG: hypothetical protein ACRCWQ_14710 [Bacilli bacterium]
MDIRTKILDKFPECDINLLDEYLLLCDNDEHDEYTENHHILPRCHWPEYENLNIHKWNSVNLAPENHVYAHWILAKCVNSPQSWLAVSRTLNSHHVVDMSETEIRFLSDVYKDYRLNVSHTEETKAKISAGLRKPDVAEYRRTRILERYSNPEYVEYFKSAINSPVAKRNHKKSIRKSDVWNNPIKRTLYELWTNNGFPKKGNLSIVAKANGLNYTANQLSRLVVEFETQGFVEPY